MNLSVFFLAVLCTISLVATSPSLPEGASLSSTDASYDGSSLTLTGHVILDHGLGTLTAEEASLQRQEAGKDFPFSLIQLRKDVLLALKNSAQIHCGSADLDFTSLSGILLPPEDGKVICTDPIRQKKGGETTLLTLKGQTVELKLARRPPNGKKTEYDIDNILAKEEVVIDYADFQLLADRALYRKELPHDNKTSRREFQGTLTAYPKNEQSQCRLSHQGDEIFADTIDIDLIHSKISLLHPRGVLAQAILPHQLHKGQMHFSSDYLYWDQGKHSLTLKGHIQVKEGSLGTLNAEDELQITQDLVKDKHLLKTIVARGPSSLVYKDIRGSTHKLVSHGFIHVDRETLSATIDSPTTGGVVPPEAQLYYEEEEIAVHADSATVEYAITDDAMQPSLLTLKGNIRLFSHDPTEPARCGVADRLTWSLTTRTLILSANPGKKVLFWDETEGMHLSAPEVHVTFDPETKRQHVRGIGTVQFSFTPEEQSKIRQLFPQTGKNP